jgi:hypothetical protein
MQIRPLNVSEIQEYDLLIDNSKEGTLFHNSWWLDAVSRNSKMPFEIVYYGAFEGEKMFGVMPIPIFRQFGIKFIYNPKLTPYLGSVFIKDGKNKIKKYREVSKIKEANLEFAKELKKHGVCLYYSFGHKHIDLQPFKWQGFNIEVHYTSSLNLDDLSKIWSNIDSRRQHEITKNTDSILIKFSEIDEYILLYNETMKRQNQKALNTNIWKDIYEACKKEHNRCEIFTGYLENEVVAALFLVWDNKRSYYLGGGIKENSHGAMSLLFWEAIKYSKEKIGLNEFDFEGSDVKSIEFYFRKFGGDIRPIFSISEDSILKYSVMKGYSQLKNRVSL